MNRIARMGLATFSLLVLANFSSQDSSGPTGSKPTVNIYGSITDTSDKTFEAENITLERMYKHIPVYQVVPKDATEKYDPTVNITRLDLSEIAKITFDPHQRAQKYNNREYHVMNVYLKGTTTVHEYLIESDKKLICDEVNSAAPIEKEIKCKALKEISIKGFKPAQELLKSPVEKTKTASLNNPDKGSKRQRFSAYIKDMFAFNKNA